MTISALRKYQKTSPIRRIIHFFVHVLIGFLFLVSLKAAFVLMTIGLFFMMRTDIVRLKSNKKKNEILEKHSDKVKSHELYRLSAPNWSFLCMLLLFFFHIYFNVSRPTIAVALFVLGIADPLAGLTRDIVAYPQYLTNKMLGSITFLISSFIVLFVSFLLLKMYQQIGFTFTLIIAFVTTFIEFISLKNVDDNVSVPLIIVLILSIIQKGLSPEIYKMSAVSIFSILIMFVLNYAFGKYFLKRHKKNS